MGPFQLFRGNTLLGPRLVSIGSARPNWAGVIQIQGPMRTIIGLIIIIIIIITAK